MAALRALRRVVEAGPEWTLDQVTRSRLSGRGGALFPMGRKWEAVRAAPGVRKYVVLNADRKRARRRPGPQAPRGRRLVEAMTIAGLAIGPPRAPPISGVNTRLGGRRFRAAVEAARARGYLGAGVLGPGKSFDIQEVRARWRRLYWRRNRAVQLAAGKRWRAAHEAAVPGHVGALSTWPTWVINTSRPGEAAADTVGWGVRLRREIALRPSPGRSSFR